MLLPVRPRPITSEAVIGYLMRVAEANGYESPRQLWHSLKSWDNLLNALKLAECEIQHLFGCLPSYWGEQKVTIQGLSISDFNHYQLRWCPLCLMDSNHARGIWLLKLCCVCTEHKIILHDKCPGCGSPQGLLRPKLDRCQCGTRLASGNIDAASLNLINVTHALELGINGLGNESALPNLTIQQWIKLALYLGQFTEKFQPAKPGQVSNLHQLSVSLSLMSNIAFLLERWPENFYQLLQAIQQKNSQSTGLRKTFGKLLVVLYRQLHEPCYQFLRDAFENYLKLHWEGLLCKRHRLLKPETILTHPQLTLKQTAKLAGTSPTMVRQLIQAEIISSFQGLSSKRRRNCAINRHQARRIAELTKNSVNLQEAAKNLNLPERRVRLLIQSGIIKPVVSRKQVNAAFWRIPRVQLSTYCLKTRQMLPKERYITLVSILKHWRLSDDEFIALIEAIQSKQILVFGGQTQPTAIGKLHANEGEFRSWLTGYRIVHSNSMTVDSAAKTLGFKQQVAYQLVHSGLLKTFSASGSGVRVSPEELHQFQASYVALSELARKLGCSPRKLLETSPIKPITGPTIDGNRQYFYRRSDFGFLVGV
jgi:TniQ